ncbi:MAG: ABC transporter permease [Deltaproteobacteria bacterium]|nr:ABC transporter permease [Deltaproteobacteria bacterium]MBW1847634.1 ABC transporter permease [Deltaproteobacteria bacterium]
MTETDHIRKSSTADTFADEISLPKRHHWAIDLILQLFRTKPLGAFGGILVMILVIVALFAPIIAPYHPHTIHGELILQPPGKQFWFGTDALARDIFSRIVWGARVSLIVGFGAVGISVLFATIIGVLSAFVGGVFDTIVQRIIDTWMSFPWLILMLTIMAILGPGMANVIFALALAGFAGGSRVIRGAVMAIRESEYVLAARATGCKKWVVIVFHILPNITAPIMVLSTLGLGNVILVEATLSFLGLGVPPPAPSWGRALSGDGLNYMLQAPWLAIFPGVAISIAVFGFNMLGDALRDLLDPKLTGGR